MKTICLFCGAGHKKKPRKCKDAGEKLTWLSKFFPFWQISVVLDNFGLEALDNFNECYFKLFKFKKIKRGAE